MNKMIWKTSLLLALVLCLSVCFTGVSAEGSLSTEPDAGMEAFLLMMQLIPGADQIDWEGFAKEFAEKQASGAEITLEDCLPEGAWALFGTMQFMD